MIRLVAFDLDGTVMDGQNRASEAAMAAIGSLVDRGVAVACISGRSVSKSQEPFRGSPKTAAAMSFGSYNGAVVMGPVIGGTRSVIHENRLPSDVLLEVADYIAASGLNFVYCRCEIGDEGVRDDYIADRDTKSVQALSVQAGVSFTYDEDLLSRIRKGALGPPPKLLIFPGTDVRDATFSDMQRTYGSRAYLVRTGEDRIEVMHPDVNKGVALREIARSHGIPLAETMSVGDGDNDLPMLRAAGVGVLLASADDETRRRSEAGGGILIGEDFEADGFARAVEEHVLAPKG
jgi:hydroxymethylpyrimidine pyrophosphatase-like HAD family hydrolase